MSKITTAIAAVALIAGTVSMQSCDSVPDPVSAPDHLVSGKVIHVSGRMDLSRAGTAVVKISLGRKIVFPDASGSYEIFDTIYAGNGVSARRANTSDSIHDTVRIVIGKDTLREVPLTSWTSVLPTNYIVQRNIGVSVPDSFAGSKVEAVWWDSDSIAHVLELGKGTTSQKYSGYIYSVYDDSMFAAHSHLYWLFVRARSATSNSVDSVKAASNTVDVTANTGDLGFDPNQFVTFNHHYVLGSALTPADSSIGVFATTKTVIMHLDTSTVYDTVVLDSAHTGKNWIKYTTNFDSTVIHGTDALVADSGNAFVLRTDAFDSAVQYANQVLGADTVKLVRGYHGFATGALGYGTSIQLYAVSYAHSLFVSTYSDPTRKKVLTAHTTIVHPYMVITTTAIYYTR